MINNRSTDPASYATASVWAGYLLITGLIIQMSAVFWPLPNYSTLVYLLYYLPLILLMSLKPLTFLNLIRKLDRYLVVLIVALFCWILISCLWSKPTPNIPNLIFKTIKITFLISFYIIGVIYISKELPKLLLTGLTVGIISVSTLALVSITYQYISLNNPLSYRISEFGFGNWIKSTNPVPAGIYFGAFTLIGIITLCARKNEKSILSTLLIPAVFLCSVTTYLTGTRTAIAALLITTIIMFWRVGHRRLCGIVIIASLCFVFIAWWGNSEYLERVLIRGGFGSWRPQIWAVYIQAGLENFWTGSGMWHDSALSVTRDNYTQSIPHSHNFFLQIFFWSGFIGLALYLAVLIRAISLAASLHYQPLGSIALFVLVYFSFTQLYDVYNIFTKPSYYWPCLWLPIGIIIGQTIDKRPEEQTP